MGVVVKVRLPFGLGRTRTPAAAPLARVEASAAPADATSASPRPSSGVGLASGATPGPATAAVAAPGLAASPPPLGADQPPAPPAAALERTSDAAAAADVEQASSTLVWLAYTSALAARATALEEATLAALEGRLEASPRRRAARETYKLATSLWLVEARDAARLAWEAAGLLDHGTLLGTANALRLSQIVESLHQTLRTLPQPDALSPAGRSTSPYLLVVDDDEALARELPIEAAVRGWRAKVIRHLGEPLEDRAAVIVLGPDVLGDADAAARARLLAAHPDAVVAALVAGPSLLERAVAHPLPARRTLAKPIAPATLVDEAVELVRNSDRARPSILLGVTDPGLRQTALGVLSGIGTVTVAHEHSEAVWDAIAQQRPELCVLDERCAGGATLHVPRALRREPDLASTAVVLLTAAGNDTAVARAAEAGADDWVPGVAVGTLLAAVVRNRLDRGRTQRAAVDVEPATRLPHLRSATPVFDRMVAIARRYHHPLALLMVEVDGMAAAQAAGESALTARLSALLGRRLARAFRAEDVVAHVAPGRFAIAAFGMKSEDGVHRMAEMLEDFREQAVQRADHSAVPASFSAGIAQIRADGRDVPELLRAAETALATAQAQGGNRIEAATRGEASRIEWTADAIVIDADAPFAALVEHALETRGLRVRTIGDGRQALELLTHAEAPVRARLIVLELGLPGLDGLTLLGQLAEAGVLKTSKAVVVTTRSVEAEMIAAMELGAVDYVTKPVSLPVLMRRLRSALSGAPGVA